MGTCSDDTDRLKDKLKQDPRPTRFANSAMRRIFKTVGIKR